MERSLLTVFSFSYNICKEILCICGSNIQPIKKMKQARVRIFFYTLITFLHLDDAFIQSNLKLLYMPEVAHLWSFCFKNLNLKSNLYL